ncbi:MAG TPA: hypothetical protein DHU56_11470 [Marinobacter sp.]|jgi:hypothetical protein|nr:hypothetical protein [Marinobacter sp.]
MGIRTDISASSPDAAAEQTEFSHITESPSDTPCAYLVDLAKYPDAPRLLFERDPAPVYDMPWIYTQTQEEAFGGPKLIIPQGDACADWLWSSYRAGRALALYGNDLTLKSISQHLVTLNKVITPFGESLFRYADSASLGTLGASLTAPQRQRILGPLNAIHGYYGDHFWVLSYITGNAGCAEPDTTEPLALTRDNLAAAESVRKEWLIRAFADSNDYPQPLVTKWCSQLETLGARSEQDLMEGMQVLADAGFEQPLTDMELSTVDKSSEAWSDRLELLAQITPQEGA